MGLEEMSVIILTNVLECYIWNLFMRSFFNYRVNSTAQRIGMSCYSYFHVTCQLRGECSCQSDRDCFHIHDISPLSVRRKPETAAVL